jgi:hypothetical protein
MLSGTCGPSKVPALCLMSVQLLHPGLLGCTQPSMQSHSTRTAERCQGFPHPLHAILITVIHHTIITIIVHFLAGIRASLTIISLLLSIARSKGIRQAQAHGNARLNLQHRAFRGCKDNIHCCWLYANVCAAGAQYCCVISMHRSLCGAFRAQLVRACRRHVIITRASVITQPSYSLAYQHSTTRAAACCTPCCTLLLLCLLPCLLRPSLLLQLLQQASESVSEALQKRHRPAISKHTLLAEVQVRVQCCCREAAQLQAGAGAGVQVSNRGGGPARLVAWQGIAWHGTIVCHWCQAEMRLATPACARCSMRRVLWLEQGKQHVMVAGRLRHRDAQQQLQPSPHQRKMPGW